MRSIFEIAVSPQAAPKSNKRRPSPISLRLSEDERAQLKRDALGQSINGYIRERLFAGSPANSRNQRGKSPVKDYEALGRALGMLGRSDVFTALTALSLAIEQEKLRVSRETETDIQKACAAVITIRADIIRALGLKPE
jgi:hypothetical protein